MNVSATPCIEMTCIIDPAELFTWALGSAVSKEDAIMCARRQPGRSWETLSEELAKMGELDWRVAIAQLGIFGVYCM